MSENQKRDPVPGEDVEDIPLAGTPTTRQLRTVGQRRLDAEMKLEQHLQEARHKNEPHDEPAEPTPSS
jgi:hypothetical protein